MTTKQLGAVILVSAATSIGSLWGYGKYQQHQFLASDSPVSTSVQNNARYTGYTENTTDGPMVDFEKAASGKPFS